MFCHVKIFHDNKNFMCDMSVRQVSKIFYDEISAMCNIPKGNNVLGEIMHNIFLFILDSFPFFDTDVIRFQESIGFVFFQRLCYQKLFSIIVHNKCFRTYFCSMGILQSDKEKNKL